MEAMVVVFRVSPVSGNNFAESEERNIEPLSIILTLVAAAA